MEVNKSGNIQSYKEFFEKVALVIIYIICAFETNAQIKDSPVLFYVREDAKYVRIVKFKNYEHYRVWDDNAKMENVIQNLKQNINFYEELFISGGFKLTDSKEFPSYNGYDGYGELKYSNMSNELWYVYSRYYPPNSDGLWKAHTQYYAYKKDFSEYMEWWEIVGATDEPKVLREHLITKQKLMEIKAVRPFLK